MITDLRKLGCTDLLAVFDRGYETEENMMDMIRQAANAAARRALSTG